MTRSLLVLILFSTLGRLELSGQEPTSVSVEEALRLFMSNNLELGIARARAAESVGLARQARAFPNPALSATHEPLSAVARSYTESYVNLSQRLELPGRWSARSEHAARIREAALAGFRADSTRLAFEAKRKYVDAVVARERRRLTERVTDVFRQAAVHTKDRFAEGDVSRYDLRRIEVERARYENLASDAGLDAAAAERDLALFLFSDDGAVHVAAQGFAAPLPPPLPEAVLVAATADRRAELAAATADLAAARAQARLARAERFPDVTATAGFKRQSDGLQGAFLGLSVPVPLFDRNGGAVATGDARVSGAEQRLSLTRRQLESDVVRAVDLYRSLARRAELLDAGASAETADLLEIAGVAYDAGEMELVELLDAARAHLDARTAETRLRAQLWIAYYDLERALGGFDTLQHGASTEDVR